MRELGRISLRIKEIIFRIIPVWHIYKLCYLRDYLNGWKARSERYRLLDGKKHVFMIGIPNYGNLGDQAISIAQAIFLKENFPDEAYQLIPCYLTEFVKRWRWMKKCIGKDDIVFFQGGGNIGDEYARAEFVRQICIHEFKNNKIILFPQTCFFNENRRGEIILHNSQKIYARHRNLIICARERVSYEMLNRFFPSNTILLVPDIVLRYPAAHIRQQGTSGKVLFCIRNDVEREITDIELKRMEQYCKKSGFTVEWTDTVIPGNAYYDLKEAKDMVDRKIAELSSAEIVVTDRLHGMVLTVLGSTNCIVLGNYNHKVKGVYEWIRGLAGIRYLDNPDDFGRLFDSLLGVSYVYDRRSLEPYFECLKEAGRVG